MKKKYTIKKRKKTISTVYIFVIILVVLISISVGYSKFSSELKMVGSVSISNQESGGDSETDITTEISKSTLDVEIQTSWTSENLYYYNMNMVLTNLDEDVTEWIMTIDLPPKVDVTSSNFWCAAEVEVTRVGNYDRLTFKNYDWNGEKPINSEIQFGFNIAFTEDVAIELTNVTFNGRLVENVIYSTNSAQYM